ncbi:cell wall-binding repeat-containing protein [Euzebya pacifica]|uniref:cell wall-binding repeat-containing protein n=1 Tax=Euzebya pacifica TaxID=1608957 RepID=UPI002483013A|nr:cell wall-binding repeat-containing protein [Euzebya pacifica]
MERPHEQSHGGQHRLGNQLRLTPVAGTQTGTPIEAAVAVSSHRFPDRADAVVLATTSGFADSLAAAPLLGSAPLLFTPPDAPLPDVTAAEIDRVLAPGDEVFILGGESAVPAEVELALDGYEVVRLAGRDRIETAIAVATAVADQSGAGAVVAVARAFGDGSAGWADSITASGWAADTGTPLVLTPTGELDGRVSALLDDLDTAVTIVLGGPAAVSDAVAAELPAPRRIAGPDRAATAAAVATELWPSTQNVVVLNGYQDDGWTLGLPAAGLSADFDAPILLVDSDRLPDSTRALVGEGCGSGTAQVETTVIGTTALISEAVAAEMDRQDGGPCPAPAPVLITSDGAVGGVQLTSDGRQAVATFTELFGPPTTISDDRRPFCGSNSLGPAGGQIYVWASLVIFVVDVEGKGHEVFWGGFFNSPDSYGAPAPPDLGLETDRGLGMGATNAEVRQLYPDASFSPADGGVPGATWTLGPQLQAGASGNGDSDTVQFFGFGSNCGE